MVDFPIEPNPTHTHAHTYTLTRRAPELSSYSLKTIFDCYIWDIVAHLSNKDRMASLRHLTTLGATSWGSVTAGIWTGILEFTGSFTIKICIRLDPLRGLIQTRTTPLPIILSQPRWRDPSVTPVNLQCSHRNDKYDGFPWNILASSWSLFCSNCGVSWVCDCRAAS